MEMRINLSYDYSIPMTQSLFLLYGEIFYLLLPYCFRNIKHDCSSIVFSLMKVHRIVELTFCYISRQSILNVPLRKRDASMNISLVKEMNVSLVKELLNSVSLRKLNVCFTMRGSLVKEMLNNVSLRKLNVCFIMRGNVPMNKVLVIYSIIQTSSLSYVFLA